MADTSIFYEMPLMLTRSASPTQQAFPSDPFSDLVRLVDTNSQGQFKIPFLNLKQYKRFMRQLSEKCLQAGPATGQYVVVTNVEPSTFDKIAKIPVDARLSYDHVKQLLIIKYMPGTIHDMVATEFFMAIRDVIVKLPGHSVSSVASLGSAMFTIPGALSKQSDGALKPSTRNTKDAWPSVVIEVFIPLLHLALQPHAYCAGWLFRKSPGAAV